MEAEGEISGSEKMKVMVAIDESECSRYALEWCIRHLQTLVNPELLIFTVQPVADYKYFYASTLGDTSPGPEVLASIQEKHKKAAVALLEKAKEICSQNGVKAHTATEVGDPKDVIVEAVEKLQIKLLIVGSHGRGFLKRAFLGSVSNYCVRKAKCPVLVVRKGMWRDSSYSKAASS